MEGLEPGQSDPSNARVLAAHVKRLHLAVSLEVKHVSYIALIFIVGDGVLDDVEQLESFCIPNAYSIIATGREKPVPFRSELEG